MARQALVLEIILTDSTFARVEHRGREVWAGKCIHCNSHLYVALDGRAISRATVEHIRPKNHGGTDALENVALACARCNQGKGTRLDGRDPGDPRLVAVVERLLARRRERWRDPPAS